MRIIKSLSLSVRVLGICSLLRMRRLRWCGWSEGRSCSLVRGSAIGCWSSLFGLRVPFWMVHENTKLLIAQRTTPTNFGRQKPSLDVLCGRKRVVIAEILPNKNGEQNWLLTIYHFIRHGDSKRQNKTTRPKTRSQTSDKSNDWERRTTYAVSKLMYRWRQLTGLRGCGAVVVIVVDSGADEVDGNGSDDVIVGPEVVSDFGVDVTAAVDLLVVRMLVSWPKVVMTYSFDVVVASFVSVDNDSDVIRHAAMINSTQLNRRLRT